MSLKHKGPQEGLSKKGTGYSPSNFEAFLNSYESAPKVFKEADWVGRPNMDSCIIASRQWITSKQSSLFEGLKVLAIFCSGLARTAKWVLYLVI